MRIKAYEINGQDMWEFVNRGFGNDGRETKIAMINNEIGDAVDCLALPKKNKQEEIYIIALFK